MKATIHYIDTINVPKGSNSPGEWLDNTLQSARPSGREISKICLDFQTEQPVGEPIRTGSKSKPA